MDEPGFIAALSPLASDPAARALLDDAALLSVGSTQLVITHDMIAAGTHFLPGDPPADVAWKLVAVNLSDLAAKGATPVGVLLGYTLSGDDEWDRGFVAGLGEALAAFDVPLLGGDTIAAAGTRIFGLTAIGRADGPVPARSGARAGDKLFVTGTIGDAGIGLAIARGAQDGPPELLAAYRRPQPLLTEGRALAPHVHAMMDVSDGLLIDAERMAAASGLACTIDLDRIPLSPALVSTAGDDRSARLAAACAGDDYQLLFAAPHLPAGVRANEIGRFDEGTGLALTDAGERVPLPASLGYSHAASGRLDVPNKGCAD